MNGLGQKDGLTFQQFQYYSVNNDLSRLELTPEDQKIIYQEIDADKNKTIDKEEMVLFFLTLLDYEESQDYERLRTNICEVVFQLNYAKIYQMLQEKIHSDMLDLSPRTPKLQEEERYDQQPSNYFTRASLYTKTSFYN